MRKPTIWFPNRSDTKRVVLVQKMARGWKFFISKVEKLYYPCSKNKGADQIHSYCEADLHLCFRIIYEDCWFSHVAAHMLDKTPVNVELDV